MNCRYKGCKNEAASDDLVCAVHLRERDQRRWKAQERRAHGRCVSCGVLALNGHARCAYCMQRQQACYIRQLERDPDERRRKQQHYRERNRERLEANRQRYLARHKAELDRKRQAWRDANREKFQKHDQVQSKQRRERWRAAGLCTKCGGPRQDEHIRCDACRAKRRDYEATYRAEYRAFLKGMR